MKLDRRLKSICLGIWVQNISFRDKLFFLSMTFFYLIISVLKFMTNHAQVSREYDILYIFPGFMHTSQTFSENDVYKLKKIILRGLGGKSQFSFF